MLRVIRVILTSFAADAVLATVWSCVYLEAVRLLIGVRVGGFVAEAFGLYMFGPPTGAAVGATAEIGCLIARLRRPAQPAAGAPPARLGPPLDIAALPRYPR